MLRLILFYGKWHQHFLRHWVAGYHVDLFHFNPPDDANSWYFIDVVWSQWIKRSGRCFVCDVMAACLGSCRHPLLFPDAKNSLQDAETQQLPWQWRKQITEMHYCARDAQLFFWDAGDDGTCWCKLQWSSFFHIKEAWLWQLCGIFDTLIRGKESPSWEIIALIWLLPHTCRWIT